MRAASPSSSPAAPHHPQPDTSPIAGWQAEAIPRYIGNVGWQAAGAAATTPLKATGKRDTLLVPGIMTWNGIVYEYLCYEHFSKLFPLFRWLCLSRLLMLLLLIPQQLRTINQGKLRATTSVQCTIGQDMACCMRWK